MVITDDKVMEIFCKTDDFCKLYDKFIKVNGLLPARDKSKRRYHRDSRMSSAEVITIMILFHLEGYRCLKHFYLNEVCKHKRHLFPSLVSYGRFTELEKSVMVPFIVFLKKFLLGKCTGISFVDSTSLRVCRNQRIHLHKVFESLAARGQCSMGFKLHLICNECGELLNFMLTPGNVDDRNPLRSKGFVDQIFGNLVGDKGYISKELFGRLFVDGIQLVTKLKNNMKGAVISLNDKLLIRKRALIETINDELKNMAQIEHSRHRSVTNFVVNLIGGLSAYCFFPKKPMIDIERTWDNELTVFDMPSA